MKCLLLVLLLQVYAATTTAAEGGFDLPEFIQEKLKAGEKRIVVQPGAYRSDATSKAGVILCIQKAEDVEIIADGVTLICTRRTRALEFQDCRNVTLQGLTIDYDPLPFTQGKVTATGDDASWIMPGFWRLFSQGTAGLRIAASTNHGTHSLHKLSKLGRRERAGRPQDDRLVNGDESVGKSHARPIDAAA